MRDYDWFAAGGSFDGRDDPGLCDAFMRNLSAASRLLDGAVDATDWRRTCGIDALYLVAQHGEEQEQPDIPAPQTSDGVRMFVVTTTGSRRSSRTRSAGLGRRSVCWVSSS